MPATPEGIRSCGFGRKPGRRPPSRRWRGCRQSGPAPVLPCRQLPPAMCAAPWRNATLHLRKQRCLCHNLFRWSRGHRSLSVTLVGEHYTGPRGSTLWAFTIMPTKICVMLDGGYVRALCKQTNRPPKDPAYIEKIAKACQAQDEVIHRIMFYDSGGFTGTARQPVSGR